MTASGHYDYIQQERVIFGVPAADAVAAEADRLGAARPFIVATRSVSRNTDLVQRIRDRFGARCAGLFDDCVAHTPRESVIAAADAVRGAQADLVVTVGGGSAIDTVKVMQICLGADILDPDELGKFHLRVDAEGKRIMPPVKPSPVRQIIVPTTLSGAEFSNLGGCTDTKRKVKDAYVSADICGRAVILDPAATVHTPDWLWLSTGIRAVDHAVEGVCSIAAMPYTDALSLHALGMLGRALRRTRRHPDDLEARLECQQAVWLASAGINRIPYGASHGIGHALGAVAGVPHGYTSCVMLPAVLRYNEAVNGDRQRLLMAALDCPGLSAADAIAGLVADLGLPGRLSVVGVTSDQLDKVAEVAMGNFWVRTNPRPIGRPEDVLDILRTVL